MAPEMTPATGAMMALMIGRNTSVLNMFFNVSRRFSAKPFPLSKPRSSASVRLRLISSVVRLQSSWMTLDTAASPSMRLACSMVSRARRFASRCASSASGILSTAASSFANFSSTWRRAMIFSRSRRLRPASLASSA